MHETTQTREHLLRQIDELQARIDLLDEFDATGQGEPPDDRGAAQWAMGVPPDVSQPFASAEKMPTILWTTDRDLQFTMVTGAGLRGLGLEADQLVGVSLPEYFQKTDPADPAIAHHLRALQGESAFFDLQWLDRVFQVYVEPMRDHMDNVIGTIGVALDLTDRQQAEARVIASEARFRALVENAYDVINMFSAHGELLYTSPSIERVLGFRPEEMKELHPFEVIHPEDFERADQGFRSCLERPGAVEHFTHRLRHKDGSYRTVEVTGMNLLEQPGIHAMVSILRDITERQQAEMKLRESEQRFRAIFNSTFQLIGLLNVDGILLEANETALAFGNVEPEDVLGQPFWETPWWGGDDARVAQLRDSVARAAAGEFVRYTVNVRGSNSTETIDFSLKPVFDSEGVVKLVVSEGRIVSEQKRAEIAHRASEDRFRRLVEHAPEAVVLLDLEAGRFTMANPAAERLFKLTADQICRSNPVDLSPPTQPDGRSSAEKARELIRQACQAQSPAFEWIHRDSAGDDIPCEVRLLPLELDGRTVIRGSVTDITERRAALEHATTQQQLGELATRLESLLAQLEVGVFSCTTEGQFLDLNNAMIELLDRESTSGTNRNSLRSLFASETQADRFLQQVVASSELQETEVELGGPESTKVFRLNARYVAPDGGQSRIEGLVEDVTRRKRAAADAREAELAAAQIAMLSPREQETLQHVVAGLANKVIARRMEVSEKMIEKHRSSLMKKLRVRSVAEVVRLAMLAETAAK